MPNEYTSTFEKLQKDTFLHFKTEFVAKTANKIFFAFKGPMMSIKESHEIARYVWTEEENEMANSFAQNDGKLSNIDI